MKKIQHTVASLKRKAAMYQEMWIVFKSLAHASQQGNGDFSPKTEDLNSAITLHESGSRFFLENAVWLTTWSQSQAENPGSHAWASDLQNCKITKQAGF